MRAGRLVTLLGLLQARGRMSTRQLAAELEVCERTVLRDVEALSSAGIPVYATRGRRGGFELLDGFTSDLAAGRPRRDTGGRAEGGDGHGAAGTSPDTGGPAPDGGVQRALIRLSPRGRRLAALLAAPAGLHIRRQSGPVPGRPDWAEAWIRVESAEAALHDLLALGAEAEVVRPPQLRAELARVARRIADLNAGDP